MKKYFKSVWEAVQTHPLACACGAFLLSSALFLFLSSFAKILLFALFLLPLPILWAVKRSYAGASSVCRIAIFLLVSLLVSLLLSLTSTYIGYNLFDAPVSELARTEEQTEILCYPKEKVYSSSVGSLYIMEVTELDGRRVWDIEILCQFDSASTPELFRFYTGTVSLSPITNITAGFDTENYYRSKGIFAQISESDELSATESFSKSPFRYIEKVRSTLKNVLRSGGEEGSGALSAAVVLADRTDLPDSLVRDFKTLGISHMLAVSGLHLSMLIGFFSFLLKKMQIRMRLRTAILIGCALLYMAVCGFSVTVTRAGIMLILCLISQLLDENSDSFTSLMFAAAVICIFSPYAILDCGFLLSFFASLGILIFNRANLFRKKQTGWKKAGRYLLSSVATSVSANIAILPIICYYFGSFSLLAPFSNLLFAPFISLILFLTPLALIFSFLPILGNLLFSLLYLLERVVTGCAGVAVYLKECTVSVYEDALLPIAIFVGLALILFLVCKRKDLCALGIVAVYILFCTVSAALPYFGQDRILIEKYKSNDIFILYSENKSCIIDLSDGSISSFSQALGVLKEHTGRQQPDEIILTHYHTRHLHTLATLAEKYYIDKIYLPIPEEWEKDLAIGIADIAMKNHISPEYYDKDTGAISFGSFTAEHFHKELLKRSTHPILSFSVDCSLLSHSSSAYLWYLSSSANEEGLLPDAHILYLGVHGPVIKSELSEELLTSAKLLYFASEELRRNYNASAGTALKETEVLVLYP